MLKLPFSSLNEEFMVTRTREVLQYRESSDPKVSKAGIQVRRWKAAEAVEICIVWKPTLYSLCNADNVYLSHVVVALCYSGLEPLHHYSQATAYGSMHVCVRLYQGCGQTEKI